MWISCCRLCRCLCHVVYCLHAARAADVGAGYGLLSLAAAARGHRVHAFELGPGSLEALEASLAHNGFEHLVKVRRHSTGSRLQRQRKMHTT